MGKSGMVLVAIVVVAWAGVARADDSVPELYRQSYALEAKGDYEGAIGRMSAVAANGAADYVAALRTGWLLYLAGRYAEAEAAYRKAMSLEPAAVEPKMGAMLPLMALRRWKEAERLGDEVLRAAPGESVVMGRMAYIQFMLGSYEKAEAWYRKVLAAFPGNVEMRAGLGWCLLKQNRFQPAKAEFDRVLSFAPDNAAAKEGRGLIP